MGVHVPLVLAPYPFAKLPVGGVVATRVATVSPPGSPPPSSPAPPPHGHAASFGGVIESEADRTAVFPPEAAVWTPFERDLFSLSGGEFHAHRMAALRRVDHGPSAASTGSCVSRSGRVSIVSPTTSSRRRFHEQLYASFQAQTWVDKELVVVETCEESEDPSPFFRQKAKEDSRIVYICLKRPAGADLSVGLKRNMCLHLASGQYIANFDDDDVYAAVYVKDMIDEMNRRGLYALTLSSWFNFVAPWGTCEYSDPTRVEFADPQEHLEVLYGYGFSYVHLRECGLRSPYPDVEFAEDAPFLLDMRARWGNDKVGLKADKKGICIHIVHRTNSTGAGHVECSVRDVPRWELEELPAARAPAFRSYLRDARTSLAAWWTALLGPWCCSSDS